MHCKNALDRNIQNLAVQENSIFTCGDHVTMMNTIDSYILKIKQVASLLNYGEPEILELFKNTFPSKLYWILFPINNLREAVDTTKRVLNKEKLDKQLTGQASNISPFMKMRDNANSGQKVLMKLQDLEAVMSMMYNISLQQGKTKKPFKPQVYQKRGRGQRQNYDRVLPFYNRVSPHVTFGMSIYEY